MQKASTKLQPLTAALIIAGALALSGAVAQPYRPSIRHPQIALWYGALSKPAYKPPDAVFAAIWPVLTGLLSIGAWRLMRNDAGATRGQALSLWGACLTLVPAYSFVTFGRRSLTGGLVVGLALLTAACAYVERAARVDWVASALGMPIALWSAFGTLLTTDLMWRNPHLDGHDATPMSIARRVFQPRD